MDGTLAAIFALVSLTDMTLNDCPSGCLAPSDATARLAFQAAAVEFDEEIIGEEVLLGYDMGRRYGPFQPSFALAITDTDDAWLGAGVKWTSSGLWSGPVFVEASLMPGLHIQGAGPDIGGALHFRSALGVGYEFGNGTTVTVAYDHRSNADRLELNPGLETLSLRVAIPLD